MAIRIGCGSWSDKEYAPLLDPEAKERKRPLAAYAQHFSSAEVNATYYAMPKAASVRQWIEQTPPGFLFDIKLHRVLSMSPGRAGSVPEGSRDLVAETLRAVEPLAAANRFGVFLLVLAGHFRPGGKYQLEHLDALAERLKPRLLAVEMRNRGWIEKEQKAKTLEYFRSRGLVWVNVDMPPLDDPSLMPYLGEVTNAKLAYIRLHGRNPSYLESKSAAEGHTYLYPQEEIKELAKSIRNLAKAAENVRVVANNHAQDFAPRTALALIKALGLSV
jgi:uncharacterized protein YecE (DUF72 family)